jgi:signal transduction histidine kinase
MSRLLNALLDISKLESGAIKPEPTDFTVAALFAELRLEFGSIAANKGLQLQIESCEQTVHSDPSLVEQILRNLLSNAVKYTREGWVRLRCVHEAALVRIEILDTLGNSLPAVLTTGDTSSAIKLLPRDPHLRITSKPIQAEELLALISELLGACERQQPLHG